MNGEGCAKRAEAPPRRMHRVLTENTVPVRDSRADTELLPDTCRTGGDIVTGHLLPLRIEIKLPAGQTPRRGADDSELYFATMFAMRL